MAGSAKAVSPAERSLYEAFRRLDAKSRRDVALRILEDEKLLSDLYDHLLIKKAMDETGPSIEWPPNGRGR